MPRRRDDEEDEQEEENYEDEDYEDEEDDVGVGSSKKHRRSEFIDDVEEEDDEEEEEEYEDDDEEMGGGGRRGQSKHRKSGSQFFDLEADVDSDEEEEEEEGEEFRGRPNLLRCPSYPLVLITVFNLGDLVSRYLPLINCLRITSRRGLMVATLARFLFIPAFYYMAKYGDQGWMIMLTFILGLTNGYLAVCALMVAPKGYKVN
ncbi:hypothetical protein MRB53_011184 [Persea americana]|uniref:Uncharacterized protein n=1 Tax=Persea americana TaxID=3435 RepID=A0ACC2LUU7_PERAE|nr:hypothetical protein MRB53_011184 [Persea americana]